MHKKIEAGVSETSLDFHEFGASYEDLVGGTSLSKNSFIAFKESSYADVVPGYRSK